MGSSTKKKKDKDRDRVDSGRGEEKSSRKRRHGRSRSHSPAALDSPPRGSSSRVTRERSSRSHKEKRRHAADSDDNIDSQFGDAEVSPAKAGRYERSGSASSGEIRDDSPPPPSRAARPGKAPVAARSPSPPRSSGAGGDASLSIDETNRLRAKLGLKPLQVGSGPPPSAPPAAKSDAEEGEEGEFDEETLQRIRSEREQEADTFWKEKQDFVHAPAQNIAAKKRQDAIKTRLEQVREKRRLEERLLGAKTLGDDSDEEADDAAKWIEKQKKAVEQKKLAEQRAKALADMDDEFGVGDVVEQHFQKKKVQAYTSKDLKGLKVLHSQERIAEGSSVILTLQDKGVLDEEDDALVNVNMIDSEKFEKNVETRKMRPDMHGYNAFDEIEFDSAGNLKEKGVLAKYDEEINKSTGVKTFTIGENISEEVRKAKIREKMQRANKVLESLEGSGLKVANDFYTEEEMVAFKKPKKKVRKVRKALRADDLLKIDADLGSKVTDSRRERGSRSRIIDDDEPAAGSSGASVKHEPMEMDLDVDDLPPRPSMDDLDDIWAVKVEDEADADFQSALKKARVAKQKKLNKAAPESMVDRLKLEPEDNYEPTGSMVLHATAEFCRTLGDIPTEVDNDIYGDEEMDFEREQEHADIAAREEERGRWVEADIDETPIIDITEEEAETDEAPILEEEPHVGMGIAGALKLAMKKGYIESSDKRRGTANGRMKHLEAQNYSIDDKSYEDERSHKRDPYSGPVSEFREKEGYKPDVKLDYVDEDGKVISSKEAFRILSHKFHGKGSGKNKVDKKRRKEQQEKLMHYMNSTDTPLHTAELLHQRQKETHSPYIVLTGKGQTTSLAKSQKR